MTQKKPKVIVLGNEKGGTGKSTVAMHLLVALLRQGLRVGSIDLDARQATLTRYIENRRRRDPEGRLLGHPQHRAVPPSADQEHDADSFRAQFAELAELCDVIVIDTPGSDHPLSRLGHSFADMLVTPLNDSFIDLDLLASVDGDSLKIVRPGRYAEMVWDTKKARALRGESASFEWFVLRNRLSTLDARNKREMERLLDSLSKRIGFRQLDGLNERVIYRELFLQGLTLLDLGEEQGLSMTLSHVAARQELRQLIEAMGLAAVAIS
ncbi:MAG TPA: division plane positioning ATPase MipZ [Magnetospirillaceae bacterium]|nr:division plane positioning ATPase MipZ [Magnetospirillaceae bacterium]